MAEMDPAMVESLEKILEWAQDQMIAEPQPRPPPDRVEAMETGPGELEPGADEEEGEYIEPEEKKSVLGRYSMGGGGLPPRPSSKQPVPGRRRY